MIKNLVEQEQLNEVKEQLGKITDDIETLETDVDNVEYDTSYGGEGSTYMGVNSKGEIVKNTFTPSMGGRSNMPANIVVRQHDKVLEALSPLKDRLISSTAETQNLHADYIYTTSKYTKVTIKFKASGSFAFLFGRSSGSAPICASIAYSAVKNLAEHGTFTVSGGVVECTLGTYAMCLLLHNGNIESITYS